MSMTLSDALGVAQWDPSLGRHHHKRRKAFVSDAYKAVRGWLWSARTVCGVTIVTLHMGKANRVCDGFDVADAPNCDVTAALAACIERLTLEALQDVARATKNRLDSKLARP